MRRFFPVVLLGSLLVTPAAADGLPNYDMARTCKLDTAAAAGLAVSESVKSCMRDEKQAHDQLETQWSTFPAAKRAECMSDSKIGGTPSYAGLQTCLQF